ncbi:MAG TPA: hypothetical protein VGA91_01100 [Candidatus Limnocylindria bacterium]|jgi:hypothetical protein
MRHLSLVASAIAAGTGVIYIGFLIKQGTPVVPLTVVVVTAAIAALAVLTAYGSLGPNPTRRALALWAAVPGFFGLGYLAGFSIGGLLLIGGILTLPVAAASLRGISLTLRAVVGWTAVILLAWAAVLAALLLPLL